jgi:hypothetical protein
MVTGHSTCLRSCCNFHLQVDLNTHNSTALCLVHDGHLLTANIEKHFDSFSTEVDYSYIAHQLGNMTLYTNKML